MAALNYAHIAAVIQPGLNSTHILRKLRLGKCQIQLAHYPDILQYIPGIGRNKRSKLSQYALNFFLLLAHELFVFIAQLNHRRGLNKQRCAAAGLIVYQSRHVLAVFLLNGYYESAVSYGYKGFLKVF